MMVAPRYTHRRIDSDCSTASGYSENQSSCHTSETLPTLYGSDRSLHDQHTTVEAPSPVRKSSEPPYPTSSQSLESIGSSVDSEGCLPDESPYEVPAQPYDQTLSDVLPATSRDFAELFPSARRLLIRHDDTTLDGNMNLRVDTAVRLDNGLERKMTLFHLRMRDLRSRQFSLRRYCRESGREICHTARKSQRSRLAKRPSMHHSLSNAFAAFRSKSDLKSNQNPNLKRHDSGYDSFHDVEGEDERPSSSHSNKAPATSGSDMINIQYANYAQIDLRRRGFKADKRYDFEFWGHNYSWKRSSKSIGHVQEISYFLIRRKDGHAVGRIVPDPLSDSEAEAETEMGGWIPPCSMWINDTRLMPGQPSEIADIAVSTGLTALVDDSIRRRFQAHESRQLIIPLPVKANGAINRSYVGPKRLIDEAFGRRRANTTD